MPQLLPQTPIGPQNRAPRIRQTLFAVRHGLLAWALGLAFSLALLSCGEPSQPSVLLLTIDTLRADRLGSYGREQAHTPNLDALAQTGVLFENAYTPVPITLPSHTSILTGMGPGTHGVRDNGYYQAGPELETAAELFRAADYSTGAFIASFPLYSQFGLDQGFDVYGHPDNPLQENRGDILEERRGAEVVAEALQYVSRLPRQKPLFLWVHLFDPHAPYEAPEGFALPAPNDAYQAEIAYVDDCFATLKRGLQQHDKWDDTIVVVVADHGEGLSEKIEPTHAYLLYEGTMRVPLILSGPGLPQSQRVQRVVSTLDILPTLMELCDLAPPRGVEGQSLLGSMRADGEIQTLFMETLYPPLHNAWSELHAVRREGYKYIEAPRAALPNAELYNLELDPLESTNLRASEPERVRELQAILRQHVAGQKSSREVHAMEQSALELLSALGYSGEAEPGILESVDLMPHPALMLHVQERCDRLMEAIRASDWERSEELLQTVVELEPNGLAAHEMRGYLHFFRADGDAEELNLAQAAFESALKIQPRKRALWAHLAMIHGERKEYPQAIAAWKTATLAMGVTRGFELQLGRALYEAAEHAKQLERRGKLGDALHLWTSLAREFPTNSEYKAECERLRALQAPEPDSE